jgi:acetylornithine deacetylase/succinyl-diaminopimelate desuccinylase-like protein
VRGKGQALFEVEITREGEALHENVARRLGVADPLDYAVRLALRFLQRDKELAVHVEPLLGPETFFLGQIHGGDFYNRRPNRAFLNGIARFWPDKDWTSVRYEFERLLREVDRNPDLRADLRLSSNGLGYTINPKARIVEALCSAYQSVVRRPMPLVGDLSVCDVNTIVREAGIPAVAHGTGSTTVHADLEWVDVANIVRSTQVYLHTIVNYLGVEG